MHRVDGFLADMMLDALGIEFGLLSRHAEFEQELQHHLVPSLALPGQSPPRIREFDGAVRLGMYQTRAHQTRHRAADRHMAHAHHLREVADTGFAPLGDQFRDRLDIIFGDLIAMVGAGPPEPFAARPQRQSLTITAAVC